MKHSVQVTILGQQYTIKSHLEPDRVKRVAGFVNGKIAEVAASHKVVDTLNTAVLALLNIAGEYLDLQQKCADDDSEVQQRMERLLTKAEAACGEDR